MEEPNLKCENCGLDWPPARLTDFEIIPAIKGPLGNIIRYSSLKEIALPQVRCVECKTVYDRELPVEPSS